MAPHPQQAHAQSIIPQAYAQQPQQQAMMAQSSVRAMHPQMAAVHRSSSASMAAAAGHHPQAAGYGYQQNPMWPPAQPQQSPMHPGMQYAQTMPSPHMHTQQSPLQSTSQIGHQSNTGSMHGGMAYQMGAMSAPAYPNIPRNPYQPSPSPQHFMQSAATTQSGMPGWAPGPQQQGQWQGY